MGDLRQGLGGLAEPRGVSGRQHEVDVFRQQLEELGADDLVVPGVEDGSEKLQELRVIHGRDPFPKTPSASATVTPRARSAVRSFRRASWIALYTASLEVPSSAAKRSNGCWWKTWASRMVR